MKAEISHKSPYWIPKHRYYELRSFCMQYPDWQKEIRWIMDHAKEILHMFHGGRTTVCMTAFSKR